MDDDIINSKYNIELEYALRQVLGKKYYGCASYIEEPKEFRKAITNWLNKLEKRIYDVTSYDFRLREKLTMTLSNIRKELKDYGKKDNLIDITTKIIYLVNYLFGFDYEGSINHNLFFYQTSAQEEKDLIRNLKIKKSDEFQWSFQNVLKYKQNIISSLKKEGLSDYRIAQIMNTTIAKLKKI